MVVADIEAARAHLVERRRRRQRDPGLPLGPVRVLQGPRRQRLGRAGDPAARLAEVPAAALEAGELATCPDRACARGGARSGAASRRGAGAPSRPGAGARAGPVPAGGAQRPSAWASTSIPAAGQAPAALVDGDAQGAQRPHDGAHLVADGDDERRRRRRAAARARRDRRRRRRTRRGDRSRAPAPTTTPAACRPRPSSSRRRRRRRRGRPSRRRCARCRSPARAAATDASTGSGRGRPALARARRTPAAATPGVRRSSRPAVRRDRGRRAASARRRRTRRRRAASSPRGAPHASGSVAERTAPPGWAASDAIAHG